jgi:uncharacterized protein (DUF427 family)
MTKSVLLPNAEHPITIEPTNSRVEVRINGELVAASSNALTLRESTYPAVQYIPLADVDQALLQRTETQTYCPYKGDASYYSVQTSAGELLTDVIWTYETPYPSVAEIAGHVAFYPDRADISLSG